MGASIDHSVWRAFFVDGPDPAFVYTVGDAPRFVLTAVNQAWLDATGIPETALGRALENLMPAEVVGFIRMRFERCIEDVTPRTFDEALQFNGQTRYWRTQIMPVPVDGVVRFIVGVGHDYTELRNTAVALAESEAKFRRIVENASDIIFRLRLEPVIALDYISPSIEAVTGYAPEEFYQNVLPLRDLLHPEDLPSLERGPSELREDAEPVLARWRHKNGDYRWMEARSSLVRDASGKVIAREGIARDVTDQRRNDEERVLLERRLQQTQKLESLGVLAGGIAHDFNNLLTGILGHISLLRVDQGASPSVLDHAKQIEIAASRAADLCRQMLAYSGKGRFSVRRVDLDELVRETTQLLKLSISKSVDLRLDLHAAQAATEADATQLQQVVMNLVLNASEACEGKQGKVTVTTGVRKLTSDERRDAFMATDLPDTLYVFVEVKDNGGGMSPETQARIFDPFFTTKFTGRGLGLSAVLGIVRGHSGAVRVHSDPGVGTTFRVLLPAAEGVVAPAPAEAPAPNRPGKGRVLVVDDEEVVRDVSSRILQALGYSVVTANDGQECVDAFKQSSEPIVAVLMDLTMPRLDGVAAFEELRRLNASVPVILMSGYNEQDAVARFAGRGLAGFLQKPFTAQTLSTKLGSALGLR